MTSKFVNKTPELDETVFVADGARVIGDAEFGAHASVWFNAVVRADFAPITVGENSNIQDNCTLHVDPGCPVTIGKNVTVGHNAVVHGATVGDNVLIGMHATILNGAVIGNESIVGAGALVTEHTVVPPRSVVLGVPAKVVRTLTSAEVEHIRKNAEAYAAAAKAYMREAAENRT